MFFDSIDSLTRFHPHCGILLLPLSLPSQVLLPLPNLEKSDLEVPPNPKFRWLRENCRTISNLHDMFDELNVENVTSICRIAWDKRLHAISNVCRHLTHRFRRNMNVHLHLLSAKPVACRQVGLKFNILKYCIIDYPINELQSSVNLYNQNWCITYLVCLDTDLYAIRRRHIDPCRFFRAWPVLPKVFMSWSYLIASLHWPTMILPSVCRLAGCQNGPAVMPSVCSVDGSFWSTHLKLQVVK